MSDNKDSEVFLGESFACHLLLLAGQTTIFIFILWEKERTDFSYAWL